MNNDDTQTVYHADDDIYEMDSGPPFKMKSEFNVNYHDFPTWEDAHSWLLKRAAQDVEHAAIELRKAQDNLNKVMVMKP
jgi:hypothetical protein